MKINLKSPQFILFIFLIILLFTSLYIGMDVPTLFNRSIEKFVMNGIFVLAMIPMINAGVGLNFGISVGIIGGLLGMLMSIEFRLKGIQGLLISILIAIPFALLFGLIYAKILNKVKGKEDIAAIFIGFSFVPLMNFFWTILPFSNREMLYPVGGSGLRPKISLNNYFGSALNSLGVVNIGPLRISLALILAYVIIALLIFLFNKSKIGLLIDAVGENEKFSLLSGINILNIRTIAIVLSTVIAAVGIIIYAQSYGFVELYDSPSAFAFPAVSSILIGGSLGKKATVKNAIIGTYIYQTIYLLSSPIANAILVPQMAEMVRMIITNSIILYAFLKPVKEKNE